LLTGIHDPRKEKAAELNVTELSENILEMSTRNGLVKH